MNNYNKSYNLWIPLLLVLALSSLTLIALGAKLASEERTLLQAQYQRLYNQWLFDYRKEVDTLLTNWAKSFLDSLKNVALTPEQLRTATRRNGIIEQIFLLSHNLQLVHPDPIRADLDTNEKGFIQRTKGLWENRKIINQNSPLSTSPGWHSYYSAGGLHIIYIHPVTSGFIGFEVNKIRLLSALIAALPEEKVYNATTPKAILLLLDEHGNELHYSASPETRGLFQPVARINLNAPLHNYQVNYLIPSVLLDRAFYGSAFFTILPVVFAVIAVLVMLTVYFYRQHSNAISEAAQQVNFVNQVSHELKTPLTNIRMYAELLQEHLDEEDPHAQGHLAIIVSESQRLSRLISTILNFSLNQRKILKLHPSRGYIKDIINAVLEHFDLGLQERGIAVKVQIEDELLCEIDADAINQILGNLIANTIKHADGCNVLQLHAWREDEYVLLRLSDDGPGISKEDAKHVFEPFYRASFALTTGKTGTGIGLSISRDLARLHGGELLLEEDVKGASFLLRIKAHSLK